MNSSWRASCDTSRKPFELSNAKKTTLTKANSCQMRLNSCFCFPLSANIIPDFSRFIRMRPNEHKEKSEMKAGARTGPGENALQLQSSDTGWGGTPRCLLLIVNGRASLLWPLQPEWGLTALSGSLNGSVAGQESGWFHPLSSPNRRCTFTSPPWQHAHTQKRKSEKVKLAR